MKELAQLLRDMEDYIAWIKLTGSKSPDENIHRLLAGVLDYDHAEDIVPVKAVNSQPAETDPTVKFVVVSAKFFAPITRKNLEYAGRLTLGYGSNLFIYTSGIEIKVINVEDEGGEMELETMMEFNLTQDDPTEIATHLWTLAKKDCGKKVLVMTLV